MHLRDALNSPESDDARRNRPPHNEATFNPETGAVDTVCIALQGIPATEQAHRDAIKEELGIDIPEDHVVVLKSVRWWGRRLEDGKMENSYCRYDIKPREQNAAVDGPVADALLSKLRTGRRPTRAKAQSGTDAFVVDWADWQVGLAEGGGTPAFLERLDSALHGTVERVEQLRRIGRSFGHLVIVGGGDMIENCAMRSNHAFELDLDRRDQIRVTTASILEGLDRLAPRFERTTVLVVGGNHGENRVDYKRTTRSDNDDCAVFEHAALAASRDARLSHVDFRIAQGEPAKTLEVAGWVLGTTHGHVYGRGAGGNIEQKVQRWFHAQAAGRHPVGDADILLTHHYHHLAVKDHGAWLWVQAPALDGGSRWYTDSSGMYSAPGMLTFVVTPEDRFRDMAVL